MVKGTPENQFLPQIQTTHRLFPLWQSAGSLNLWEYFLVSGCALKKLQFSGNKITELPAAIGNLVELRHFNMSNNQIASIPESISRLTRLRVCDLSDNPFTSLPEAFGQVQIVNQLRVKNCPITTLPVGFATMRATIDITGSKIDPARLPPELRSRISTKKPPGSKEPEKK